MPRTWIAITVELVSGMGDYCWPRPGRVLLAKRSTSFRQLARAIDSAFGRWDLSHLHRFSLSDGSEVVPLDWWEDATGDELDDARTSLARLGAGEVFAYEFDFGDAWEHVCTVEPERVDPEDLYGEVPPGPVVIDSWGSVPDQYGRRWRDDDGEAEVPPQPDLPAGDLPPLMPGWGPPGASAAGSASSSPADQRVEWELREWDDAAWRALRAAVYQRNAEAVIEALRRRDPVELAQLAGDGVLLALEEGVGEAVGYALLLIRRLSERQGPGDGALVDELRSATGHADATKRRPLPVDLADVAMHLQGDDLMGGWRIDIRTGRWWPDDPSGMMGEEPPSYWEDDDRWLDVDSLGPHEAWQDMSQFIEGIDDAGLAERLREAIEGRGAFRRFKDLVHNTDDLGRRWQRFSDERERGRARAWLAQKGFRPVPPDGAASDS
jgi:hypothetical protein